MKSASTSGRWRPRKLQYPAASANPKITMMSAMRSMKIVPTVREAEAP